MFTKKHYEAIADLIHKRRLVIKDTQSDTFGSSVRLDEMAQLVVDLSALFAKDNPKFKQFQFIAVCNRDLAPVST